MMKTTVNNKTGSNPNISANKSVNNTWRISSLVGDPVPSSEVNLETTRIKIATTAIKLIAPQIKP